MNIEIRKANLSNSEVIREILQQSLNFKNSLGDDAWGSDPYTVAEIQGLLKRGDVFLVYKADEAVATVSVEWADERMWGSVKGSDKKAVYVHKLAVADDYRSQGLGAYIIDWVGQQAKIRGRNFVRLDCGRTNKSLCNYYQSLGFIIIGTTLLEDGYDSVLFERTIT